MIEESAKALQRMDLLKRRSVLSKQTMVLTPIQKKKVTRFFLILTFHRHLY